MRPNIGIVNALIRITCGLTMLAWSTSRYCKKPWRESYLVIMTLAAMKVGEGILRFCPITYLFERTDFSFFNNNDDYEDEDYIDGEYVEDDDTIVYEQGAESEY
ncbi:YgaP family membrane protein [Metabacillus malikii]|uniref:Inner membrane protein YgaP-like transmembrane domain-containing protein n=1 Tax=Metabacillus malikii TaxID=1504265 RepID=A0ABT9ZDA8_9BACI|nr:DUF2892 domain-containing protein [Metabacillus malikii]MDQ0230222.1 hypothetical protein [Metabacillus malikii]